MSNTRKGPGKKGSKKWMQHFVNTKDVVLLINKIQTEDNSISGLKWLSPLHLASYGELRTGNIPHVKSGDIAFWPSQGPWWDAIATYDNEGILLVEAKAHLGETSSKCKAKAEDSINRIKLNLQRTFESLAPQQVYDEKRKDTWFSKYYQLANRLAFLHHLRAEGKNVRLLLLNFVNDTYKLTTEKEWRAHSEKVWIEMLGCSSAPKGVLEICLEVQ